MAIHLEDYDISRKYGFVSFDLERLDSYYEPWELALDEIVVLIENKKIRERIDQLPLLDISHLKSAKDYKRALVVLTFLTHAYVWGETTPTESLPAAIAVPIVKVADHLGMHPISNHLVLGPWNCRLRDPNAPATIENITIRHTFMGSPEEAWFYHVTVSVEAAGADAIAAVVDGIEAVHQNDATKLVHCLKRISAAILRMSENITRMYDNLSPSFFFNRIRHYISGWNDPTKFPKGLLYTGVGGKGSMGEYRQYVGATAAQSSLLQALDAGLGVIHYDENGKPKGNSTLIEMRGYMLGAHRQFIEKLEEHPYIREYVHKSMSEDLVEEYNKCIQNIKAFRDYHVQIVTRYIIIQAKIFNKDNAQGTGGTAIIPFLRQLRDETNQGEISK
ncbi:uncharacterized protein VTP21DRAFT_3677 [Calcarisporiella thermophila]|uniref:uncharacterized protein n=1 Tax=Calcarisporiella thermophila TaxID=911321 RepID=UPI003744A085